MAIKCDDNVSWEKLLSPAPMGIAIMSQLMICASRISDMRIDKKPGHLMRHPESFRTTLVQIGNDAYTTFMKAHSNMERIQIQMAQVPGYVQESAKIIRSDNKNAIEKMLPRRLENIREAAVNGEKLSIEVANEFNQLITLINQVLDAIMESVRSKEQMIAAQIEAANEEQKQREMLIKESNQKEVVQEKKGLRKWLMTIGIACSTSFLLPSMLVVPLLASTFALASTLIVSSIRRQKIKETEAARLEDETKQIHEEHIKKLRNSSTQDERDIYRDQTIEFLNQGLKYLTDLKVQWTGITRYFENVKNIIDQNLLEKLKDLTAGNSEDANLIDSMANSIVEAEFNSQLTYQIADKYVSVSNRYIVGNVASIQQMMSLKENELDEARGKIQISCKEASEGILAKVQLDGGASAE